jgi:flagellar assembly factor FliW
MKTIELIEPEKPVHNGRELVQLPGGLLGFESFKNFLLVTNPPEAPFQWLQMMEGPKRSFLVVSPFLVLPEYQPDISESDVKFLELDEPSDAILLGICIIRGQKVPSINLSGPIVLNRHTLIGKQCILNNAANYSSRHPLPVT